MMRVILFGFSTLKTITEVATMAASGGFFKIVCPHVVHP